MKNPVTDLAGHLCWTRSGTVWATWRLTPLAWNRSLVEQEGVAKLHRMLLRALQGEALMLSSMIPMDPVDVVDKMLGDFDLSQAPGWIVEVEATLDRLAGGVRTGCRCRWPTSAPIGGRSRAGRCCAVWGTRSGCHRRGRPMLCWRRGSRRPRRSRR